MYKRRHLEIDTSFSLDTFKLKELKGSYLYRKLNEGEKISCLRVNLSHDILEI